MKTVAILPGLAEGSWHSRYLEQELQKAGFTVTDAEAEANILIAHSAGCFAIPQNAQAHTVMLVGPPYWPKKSPVKSMIQKIYYDFRATRKASGLRQWLYKCMWNLFYLPGSLPFTMSIPLRARTRAWPTILSADKVVVIRNHHDPWTTPNIAQLLKGKGSFIFKELPGEHDDLWRNPQPYINLLQSK